jgi:Superfamily II DNA and RNA helicases
LDLANKKQIDFSHCKILALDEADKLLSIDFQPVIEKLIKLLPPERQILMFSATFPTAVKGFKDQYMPDCAVVNLMEELTLKGVTQYYVYLEEKQKIHCLNTLFSKVPFLQNNLLISS